MFTAFFNLVTVFYYFFFKDTTAHNVLECSWTTWAVESKFEQKAYFAVVNYISIHHKSSLQAKTPCKVNAIYKYCIFSLELIFIDFHKKHKILSMQTFCFVANNQKIFHVMHISERFKISQTIHVRILSVLNKGPNLSRLLTNEEVENLW